MDQYTVVSMDRWPLDQPIAILIPNYSINLQPLETAILYYVVSQKV